jgi:glutamate-1-semialdehyde 2,1-aminomutase
MLTVFFTEAPAVNHYTDAKTSNTERFGQWFRALLERGVYWAPSQFEAIFLAAIWTQTEESLLLEAANAAFQSL